MHLTIILQILQVFLAVYVIFCFYVNKKSSKTCSCCGLILLLVISIMIVPPIGRKYMSAVTIDHLDK
jgi:predicted membrane protein